MTRITAEKFARAFATMQADLLETEGLAVRQFRARRALNRQAPEPTKRDRHIADSRNFKSTGETHDSP